MKARPEWYEAVWHHGRPGKVTDWWPGSDRVTVRYDDGQTPTHAWSVPWRELEASPATSPERSVSFPSLQADRGSQAILARRQAASPRTGPPAAPGTDLKVVTKKKGKGNPWARGASQRLSPLQKRILACLYAEHQRTHGSTSASHQALVQAVAGDKSNVSRSLRNLEQKGLVSIGHTPGGYAAWVRLTATGMVRATQALHTGNTATQDPGIPDSLHARNMGRS